MEEQKKQKVIQVIKFVLFSISAGAIQILSFTLLNVLVNWGERFADTDYGPNYFISLVLSVLWNFTFNRKFTFKSANNVPIAMLKVFAYYCVFTPLSIWWGIALTKAVPGEFFKYVVLIATMLINMATEFLVCKFWVYRNSENTNDLAKKEQAKATATSEQVGDNQDDVAEETVSDAVSEKDTSDETLENANETTAEVVETEEPTDKPTEE